MAMMYHTLLKMNNETDYKNYYINNYCNCGIYTHYGLRVNFKDSDFEHAFYASQSRREKDKSLFSRERAERIEWIKKALQDKNLTLYDGWDSKKKRYDPRRRVSLVTPDGYVVVIRLTKPNEGRFVTAFVIDNPDVLSKIQGGQISNLNNNK